MIEQLFPDAAGLRGAGAADLLAASQAATPCALPAAGGAAGGGKLPLTPSAMLNALVDAF